MSYNSTTLLRLISFWNNHCWACQYLLCELTIISSLVSRTDETNVEGARELSAVVNHSGFDEDSSDDSSDDNEEDTQQSKRVRTLDPAGLAIGALLVQSRKKRQDLIDSGYNRWTSDDSNLPDWFTEDENNYCQKQLPITKDMVDEYRKKLKEINARPIKKIAEAKARKKQRATRKLNKAREKARVICDTPDVTDQEKVRQIKGMNNVKLLMYLIFKYFITCRYLQEGGAY